MPTVSVIIPNYNGIRFLSECLDALAHQTRPAEEIIVVDDASQDDSVHLVQGHYPQVTLITLPINKGFCKAANIGLRTAHCDLIALLNNDTVPDSRWLGELTAAMQSEPAIGSCASKMLFYDQCERINSAGLFLRVDGIGRDIGYDQPDGAEFSQARAIFGASGGAAMYRRAMLEDVGWLDEDFVAYAEDLDLSFRAHLRGWGCWFMPTALVRHRVSATYQIEGPTKVYYSSRNMLTVILKNMPARLVRRYAPLILAAQIYQVSYFTLRGCGRSAIRGKWAALRALNSTLAKRRGIQQSRCVSDSQVEALLTPLGMYGRLGHAHRG